MTMIFKSNSRNVYFWKIWLLTVMNGYLRPSNKSVKKLPSTSGVCSRVVLKFDDHICKSVIRVLLRQEFWAQTQLKSPKIEKFVLHKLFWITKISNLNEHKNSSSSINQNKFCISKSLMEHDFPVAVVVQVTQASTTSHCKYFSK